MLSGRYTPPPPPFLLKKYIYTHSVKYFDKKWKWKATDQEFNINPDNLPGNKNIISSNCLRNTIRW